GGDAVPLLTAAQARYPNDFWINLHLAGALHEPGKLDEALGYYRAALALRPEVGAVHNNFGIALANRGRLDEAIGPLQQASPRHARPHPTLAAALRPGAGLDEPPGHSQQPPPLRPRSPRAHNGPGAPLPARGRLEEAIRHYREALRLDPRLPQAHSNLGAAL